MLAFIALFFPAAIMVIWKKRLFKEDYDWKAMLMEYIAGVVLINFLVIAIAYVFFGSEGSIVENINEHSLYAIKYQLLAVLFSFILPFAWKIVSDKQKRDIWKKQFDFLSEETQDKEFDEEKISLSLIKSILLEKKKAYVYVIFALASILFGIAAALTPYYKQDSTVSVSIFYGITGCIAFVLFCALLYLLSALAARRKTKKTINKLTKNRVFIISLSLLILIGIIYLIIFYPGTANYDTIAIIKGEGTSMMSQHPWFYILLVRAVRNFVFVLGGGYETAFVLLSLIQIVLFSIVYAYCITWLYGKIIVWVWIIISAIVIFNPVLNIYTITLLKDVPFSLLLIGWMLFLYNCWKSGGKNLCRTRNMVFVGVLLVLSLMRNNGVYVSAFMILLLAIMYRRMWKRILVMVLILACTVMGSHVYENSNDVTHLFKETAGIPLQQMAGVVYYGGEITDEQYEFLDSVISAEYILENYNPYSADKLKWGGAPLDNTFLNSNKAEFLKIWAQMLIPNIDIYVDVYLRNTYGFWSLDDTYSTAVYTSLYVSSFDEWYESEDVSIKTILPEKAQSALESDITMLIKASYLGAGQLFWIFIALLIAVILRKGTKAFLIAAPVIGNWLTIMISTPVAYQWRYAFSLAIAVPIMLGILFINEGSRVHG